MVTEGPSPGVPARYYPPQRNDPEAEASGSSAVRVCQEVRPRWADLRQVGVYRRLRAAAGTTTRTAARMPARTRSRPVETVLELVGWLIVSVCGGVSSSTEPSGVVSS